MIYSFGTESTLTISFMVPQQKHFLLLLYMYSIQHLTIKQSIITFFNNPIDTCWPWARLRCLRAIDHIAPVGSARKNETRVLQGHCNVIIRFQALPSTARPVKLLHDFRIKRLS